MNLHDFVIRNEKEKNFGNFRTIAVSYYASRITHHVFLFINI